MFFATPEGAKNSQWGALTSLHNSHTDKAACRYIGLVSAGISQCRLSQNASYWPDKLADPLIGLSLTRPL